MTPFPEPWTVTLVRSEACHFCDDAQEVLRELARDHPIHLAVVPIDSPAGRALVAAHRPAMNPLVLVDGAFFSAGRFPRKKFLRMLLGGRGGRGVVGRLRGGASQGSAPRGAAPGAVPAAAPGR
ncbi:MAG: glutaredoxin family protein [Actinotalea sp.]|nr:glutaredoxin family protein [Actinotalea sp.]